MGERDANARRAMRDLRHSLSSLDDCELVDLRASLDAVEEERRPPPPPDPEAVVELLDWRTNSVSGVRNGSMPEEAIVRSSLERWTLNPGGYNHQRNLRVGPCNLAVDVRVRGKGVFEVWWSSHLTPLGRSRQTDRARPVWTLPFDCTAPTDHSLPSTSLPGNGYVIFVLRALPL